MRVDCRVTVVVDADTGTAWDRRADVAHRPGWKPACLESSLAGPAEPGTVMNLRRRHPSGRGFRTRPRRTDVQRPGLLAWEVRAMGVRARTEIEVAAEEDGPRVTLAAESGGAMSVGDRWAMPPRTQAAILSEMVNGLAGSVR